MNTEIVCWLLIAFVIAQAIVALNEQAYNIFIINMIVAILCILLEFVGS